MLKYHEPPEARKPPASQDWRLFTFKGEEQVDPPIPLAAQSCWLLGRERAVADLRVDHPSASKQHAVIQFRDVPRKGGNDGVTPGKLVKPYVIDLESSNGTRLNGDRIPAKAYWEVKSGDVLMIGHSEREYVFLLAPKE